MKKIFYLIAVLALGMTACIKNEIQAPAESASDAPVYRFSLPASFDAATGTKAIEIGETAITNSFSTDDKVYVYIQRADGTIAVAHDGINAATYLVPAEIDGTKCTLDGELRFYCDVPVAP